MERAHRPLLLALVIAGAGLLPAGSVLIPGCSNKDESKPAKVDCDAFCERTFETCAEEYFVASGRMAKKKATLFKKLNILPRIEKEGRASCLKTCRARGGRGADAAGANRCMKLEDCKKFAACILKYSKPK